MLFINIATASAVFEISEVGLRKSATRNSQKYPFLRVDASSRSRGGKRLLFAVKISQLEEAINSGKIDRNIRIFDKNFNEISLNTNPNLAPSGVLNLGYDRNLGVVGELTNGAEVNSAVVARVGVNSAGVAETMASKPINSDTRFVNSAVNETNGLANSAMVRENSATASLAMDGANLTGVAGIEASGLMNSTMDGTNSARVGAIAGVKPTKTDTIEFINTKTANTETIDNTRLGVFHSASRAKKDKAVIKKYILDEWANLKKNMKLNDFLDYINFKYKNINLTKNKLYAWIRAYNKNGIDALIDERTSNKANPITTLGLEDIANKIITASKGRVNYNGIYKQIHYAAVSMGLISHDDFISKKDEVISYKAVMNYTKKFLKEHPIIYSIINGGEDFAVSKHYAALGKSNRAALGVNDIVEIDASPLDVMCNASTLCDLVGFDSVSDRFRDRVEFENFVREWQKRYTIIGLIDTYSGICSFYVGESENSYAIARASGKYICKYGLPRVIKGDNGKAFTSNQSLNYLKAIDVEYRAVRAYSGWMKPYVEKNFGSLQNGLSEWLRGYIGHNITSRQAIEFFFSKKERRLKKGQKSNQKELMNLRECEEIIDSYTDKFLNNRYLDRLGKSPIEVFNEASNLRTIHPAKVSLYMGDVVEREVHKKGISYLGGWFYNIEMFNHSSVKVRANINNNKECFVWDMKDNFIGVALELDLDNGVSVESAKAAQKIVTKRIKSAKNLIANNRREVEENFTRYIAEVKTEKVAKKLEAEADNNIEDKLERDRRIKRNGSVMKVELKESRKIKGWAELAKCQVG